MENTIELAYEARPERLYVIDNACTVCSSLQSPVVSLWSCFECEIIHSNHHRIIIQMNMSSTAGFNSSSSLLFSHSTISLTDCISGRPRAHAVLHQGSRCVFAGIQTWFVDDFFRLCYHRVFLHCFCIVSIFQLATFTDFPYLCRTLGS